jgi:glycosyltransferase involved in cell wall biosynthesis
MGALRDPVSRGLARTLEWLAYRLSARVVALSPGMAAGVQRRGVAEDRVVTIPNASAVHLFQEGSRGGAAVRARLGLDDAQPLVVYTGTFGRVNGVDYLVELASHLANSDPDVRFLLVGGGALRGEVEGLARARGLLGRTVYVERPIPKVELPELLAAATVATSTVVDVPALHHNSANKFFDTLAAGRPIVINHRGWQADLIEGEGVGLVLPPTPDAAAARRLVDYLRDRDGLAASGARALELARERFDVDLLADRLAGVLETASEEARR